MVRRFIYVSTVVFTCLILSLPACSSRNREKQRQTAPVPVTAAAAVRQSFPLQINAIGTAAAFSAVTVRSKVAGEIIRVGFREGQDVKQGHLLFTIDCRDMAATLKQAEANLARDTALSRNADEEAARYKFLAEKGYVAKQQYDQVKTNAESARAVVVADQAAVENARVRLGYCSIHSPISGRTGNLKVDQGNLVKENESELVSVNQISPIYVGLTVPEKYLPEIKRYSVGRSLKVHVYIPGDALPEEGVLTFIDNRVDNTTGTIALKATIKNERRRLWPGQFLNVVVTLTEQTGVLVPTRAVLAGQNGTYVFVVKPDSVVEVRTVETTRTYRDQSVIDKGLEPGERVVLDGQLRLVQGAKVTIKGP